MSGTLPESTSLGCASKGQRSDRPRTAPPHTHNRNRSTPNLEVRTVFSRIESAHAPTSPCAFRRSTRLPAFELSRNTGLAPAGLSSRLGLSESGPSGQDRPRVTAVSRQSRLGPSQRDVRGSAEQVGAITESARYPIQRGPSQRGPSQSNIRVSVILESARSE